MPDVYSHTKNAGINNLVDKVLLTRGSLNVDDVTTDTQLIW